MNRKFENRGVILLLAILIMTAALAVSLGIFNVIFTELQISKGARESYKAFYSADAAKECIFYYAKKKNSPFLGGFWNPAEPCGSDSANGIPPDCHIDCLGMNLAVDMGEEKFGSTDCNYVGLPTPPSGESIRSCRRYSLPSKRFSSDPICTESVTIDAVTYDPASFLTSVIVTANGLNNCTSPIVNRTLQGCNSPDPATHCP